MSVSLTMNKYKNLTLFVYRGNYDLPSIDPKCAQILFYLKLHPGHKITIVNTECSSNPLVPCLYYKKMMITDQKQIFEILYREVIPLCDMKYNPQQRVEITEYNAFNENMIVTPYILHSWGVKANARYLKRLYSSEKNSCVKKEFSLTLIRYNKMLMEEILDDRTFDMCSEFGIASVDVYLEHLEGFIAGKVYMFGNTPSTFDAHVCGYLAPLLRLKFPNTDFQKKLLKRKKLCKYIRNFLKNYGEKYIDRFPTMMKPKHDNWSLKCFTQCVFWISLTGLIWSIVISSQIKEN